MKSEKEIKDVQNLLSKLTGFIADHGSDEEQRHRDFEYACNIDDVLSWILMDVITTESFLNDYIEVSSLES